MNSITMSILILLLGGCANLSDRSEAKTSMEIAEPLISSIETYKSMNGAYPSEIEDLQLPETIINDLNSHGIGYKTWNDRTRYAVSFKIIGLMPSSWCGYGSDNKEWQCLLK